MNLAHMCGLKGLKEEGGGDSKEKGSWKVGAEVRTLGTNLEIGQSNIQKFPDSDRALASIIGIRLQEEGSSNRRQSKKLMRKSTKSPPSISISNHRAGHPCFACVTQL